MIPGFRHTWVVDKHLSRDNCTMTHTYLENTFFSASVSESFLTGNSSLILGKHFLFPESTVAVEQSPPSIAFVSFSMTCPETE